jgi:hypothetical protein
MGFGQAPVGLREDSVKGLLRFGEKLITGLSFV